MELLSAAFLQTPRGNVHFFQIFLAFSLLTTFVLSTFNLRPIDSYVTFQASSFIFQPPVPHLLNLWHIDIVLCTLISFP